MSSFGFLSSGETMDCLKGAGTVPVDSDRLMMLVIVGARIVTHCSRREAGIGSSSHCLFGAWRISFVVSSVVVGRN